MSDSDSSRTRCRQPKRRADKLALERSQWKCAYCWKPFDGLRSDFQIDHVVPQSVGGANRVSNLQALCLDCHNRKTKRELPSLTHIRREIAQWGILAANFRGPWDPDPSTRLPYDAHHHALDTEMRMPGSSPPKESAVLPEYAQALRQSQKDDVRAYDDEIAQLETALFPDGDEPMVSL